MKYKLITPVILAAGMGKRMNSTMLKVMHEVHGRPMVDYVVSTVEKAGLNKPIVVVCDTDPAVQNFLGGRADYAIQVDRLGTGHAVSMAAPLLSAQSGSTVVLYGDMPFISPESIERLVTRHEERGNTVTLMTVTVTDFSEWREAFYSFGRIIRGADGHIVKITEKKDATEAELTVTELNPGIYCFKNEWLLANLGTLKNNNAQQEYYITDLIGEAIRQGQKISSITIEPREALGINSPEDLARAEGLV